MLCIVAPAHICAVAAGDDPVRCAQFHIVAGELRAVGCVSCKFYVWCSTSPIIDSCRGLGYAAGLLASQLRPVGSGWLTAWPPRSVAWWALRFGEWHVAYPGLAAQYQLAGLDPLATNLSRDVRDSTDGDMAAVDSGRVWTLLPPQPELSVDPGTCTSVAPPAAAATGVDADATATKTEDTTADAETEATQFYSVVYSGVVAVRDAPQRDAEEVGERLPGEVVEVAEVIESGWVRLQPPPGYTGTDRYMCIEQAGTTLLTPVPASQVSGVRLWRSRLSVTADVSLLLFTVVYCRSQPLLAAARQRHGSDGVQATTVVTRLGLYAAAELLHCFVDWHCW